MYQKKPLITPRHPSRHQHTAPKSPCTRKNLLSPLVTTRITNTLHQNHPIPEKTSYHPSSPPKTSEISICYAEKYGIRNWVIPPYTVGGTKYANSAVLPGTFRPEIVFINNGSKSMVVFPSTYEEREQ